MLQSSSASFAFVAFSVSNSIDFPIFSTIVRTRPSPKAADHSTGAHSFERSEEDTLAVPASSFGSSSSSLSTSPSDLSGALEDATIGYSADDADAEEDEDTCGSATRNSSVWPRIGLDDHDDGDLGDDDASLMSHAGRWSVSTTNRFSEDKGDEEEHGEWQGRVSLSANLTQFRDKHQVKLLDISGADGVNAIHKNGSATFTAAFYRRTTALRPSPVTSPLLSRSHLTPSPPARQHTNLHRSPNYLSPPDSGSNVAGDTGKWEWQQDRRKEDDDQQVEHEQEESGLRRENEENVVAQAHDDNDEEQYVVKPRRLFVRYQPPQLAIIYDLLIKPTTDASSTTNTTHATHTTYTPTHRLDSQGECSGCLDRNAASEDDGSTFREHVEPLPPGCQRLQEEPFLRTIDMTWLHPSTCLHAACEYLYENHSHVLSRVKYSQLVKFVELLRRYEVRECRGRDPEQYAGEIDPATLSGFHLSISLSLSLALRLPLSVSSSLSERRVARPLIEFCDYCCVVDAVEIKRAEEFFLYSPRGEAQMPDGASATPSPTSRQSFEARPRLIPPLVVSLIRSYLSLWLYACTANPIDIHRACFKISRALLPNVCFSLRHRKTHGSFFVIIRLLPSITRWPLESNPPLTTTRPQHYSGSQAQPHGRSATPTRHFRQQIHSFVTPKR